MDPFGCPFGPLPGLFTASRGDTLVFVNLFTKHRRAIRLASEELLVTPLFFLFALLPVGFVLLVVHFSHTSQDGAQHDIIGDIMFIRCIFQSLCMLSLAFAFTVVSS